MDSAQLEERVAALAAECDDAQQQVITGLQALLDMRKERDLARAQLAVVCKAGRRVVDHPFGGSEEDHDDALADLRDGIEDDAAGQALLARMTALQKVVDAAARASACHCGEPTCEALEDYHLARAELAQVPA